MREPVRAVLERELQRKVELEAVRLDLAGLGLAVSNVVIHEDPAFGLEPFIYVPTLEIRLRLSSLWKRDLRIAGIRLIEPSVNLAKNEEGEWNFANLMGLGVVAAEAGGEALPGLALERGRVNFRLGDTKSVYYFTMVDLSVRPEAEGARVLRLEFSGEPARSDRTAHGFGEFRLEGRWIPRPNQPGFLEVTARLQESSLAEVITLFRGFDPGVHGRVAAQVSLRGPLSALDFEGRLQLPRMYRWDLLPKSARRWELPFQGRLDLPAQTFSVQAQAGSERRGRVSLRLRILDFWKTPHLGITLGLHDTPATEFIEAMRDFGWQLGPAVRIDGSLVGALGYSSAHGVNGMVAVRTGSLQFGDAEPMAVTEAMFEVGEAGIRLRPTLVRRATGDSVFIQVDYMPDVPAWDVRFSVPTMTLVELARGLSRLPGLEPLPLLGLATEGSWSGWLRYRRRGDSPGTWAGSVHVRRARFVLPHLQSPLLVDSASVRIDEQNFQLNRMRGSLYGIRIEGMYSYDALASRGHKWKLSFPSLSGEDLERALTTVWHKPRGFLATTLGFGARPVDEWWTRQGGQGEIRIAQAAVGGLVFDSVVMNLYWHGRVMVVSDLQAKLGSGQAAASGTIDLSGAVPSYRGGFQLSGLEWSDGTWSLDGTLETSGTADDWRSRLRAHGSFAGRRISLPDRRMLDSVTGCFEVSPGLAGNEITFTCLEAIERDQVFLGKGTFGPNGIVAADLRAGNQVLAVRAPRDRFPMGREPSLGPVSR